MCFTGSAERTTSAGSSLCDLKVADCESAAPTHDDLVECIREVNPEIHAPRSSERTTCRGEAEVHEGDIAESAHDDFVDQCSHGIKPEIHAPALDDSVECISETRPEFHAPALGDFVDCIHEVKSDGHCGFRCISQQAYGDEAYWWIVRRDLHSHLHARAQFFKDVLSEDGVPGGFMDCDKRINNFNARASEKHWFICPSMAMIVADCYNTLCVVLTDNPTALCQHKTYVPFQKYFRNEIPQGIISLVHSDGNHFRPVTLRPHINLPTIDLHWTKCGSGYLSDYYYDRWLEHIQNIPKSTLYWPLFEVPSTTGTPPSPMDLF